MASRENIVFKIEILYNKRKILLNDNPYVLWQVVAKRLCWTSSLDVLKGQPAAKFY